MIQYYSEQERGPVQRTAETISPAVWGGVVAAVTSAVQDGSFGEDFPEVCPDGSCVCGTDIQKFSLALQAEIPGVNWPLQTEISESKGRRVQKVPYAPETLDILDFIQFCYRHVSKAVQGSYHSYFRHHHLSFDRDTGRDTFRDRINRIFSRNGIAFDLRVDGSINRIAPPVLANDLRSPLPPTGDSTLDRLFEDARRKFLSPDLSLRTEALEKLWDAWERLKTVCIPTNKKESVACLLETVSPEPNFRACLDREARELTDIGNSFMIRHSEVQKVPIKVSAHVDYLFHRLFALMHLMVKTGLK
ncbi:MAG: hypothetical protein NDI81_14170 [Desulfobacula sp.]|nr:hypothetical protein [Desulfobacula sp.]